MPYDGIIELPSLYKLALPTTNNIPGTCTSDDTDALSSSAAAAPQQVTLIVRLYIRHDRFEQFRERYSLFLHRCSTEVAGHISVNVMQVPPVCEPDDCAGQDCESATVSESDAPSRTIRTHTLEVIQTFASMQALRDFSVSPLRQQWHDELQAYLSKSPEFYSYSGLTSFFSLGREWRRDPSLLPTSAAASAHAAQQPPPKWKIGFIVWIVALVWSLVIDFSGAAAILFDLMVPASPSSLAAAQAARAGFNLFITSVYLLPGFFLFSPWLMGIDSVAAWMIHPWPPPSCDQTHPWIDQWLLAPIRWMLY